MSQDQLEMSDLKSALEDLPKVVIHRVNALKNISTKYVDATKKMAAEVRAIEQRYQTEVFAPLFEKRATIVNGSYEPTSEESKASDPVFEPTNNPDGEAKGIPNFWLTVLQNNQFAASNIFEQDEDALVHLQDVKVANLPSPQHGFTITFHFSENPFFSDTVLTKTYHLEEDETFGELVLQKAEGCTINWKPNKNLTVRVVTQKAGGKNKGAAKGKKGAARTVKKEEPQESFFQFFSPPDVPEDDEEPGPEDEMLEADFELGCIFKDKLVPFAALWFTGEAAEFDEDFGDEFDENDFDDEDDEDDEDDDEDDDDEDDEPAPPKKGRGSAKGGAAGKPFPPPAGAKGDQPQQPECKQQ